MRRVSQIVFGITAGTFLLPPVLIADDQQPETPTAELVAKADEATHQPPVNPTTDYGTLRAKLVETQQGMDPEATNHWGPFVHSITQISGAWAYFGASNSALIKYGAEDPVRRRNPSPNDIVLEAEARSLIPELRAFMARLDELNSFQALREITPTSRCVAPRSVDSLLNEYTSELGAFRTSASLMSARMWLALEDNDIDRAAESLEYSLAGSRAITGRAALLNGLVAMAGRSLVLRHIAYAVADGLVSGREAGALLRVIHANPNAIDLRVVFDGERYQALDAIDRFFGSHGPKVDDNAGEAGDPTAPGEAVASLGLIAPRDEQARLANSYFDNFKIIIGGDFDACRQARSAIDAINKLIEDHKGTADYQPAAMLLPALDKVHGSFRRLEMVEAGTRTMLALEIYREREGTYPESLDLLVPKDLTEVPRDPYALSGSLRYKALRTEVANPAESYLLYSVGHDGTDNEGRVDPKGMENSLGPGGSGFDFVLNRRDR